LGLLLVPLTQILIFKTNLGLKIRTVGENPRQADALGVSVPKIRYLAVIIGGALAGIGGSYLALVTTGSFLDNITAGQGWIALAVVIFGRWKPIWILMGAWLFGMVDALQLGLQAIGTVVPAEFLLMLPYILPIGIMAAMYKRSAVPAALAMPYRRGQR
jgi:simple sugar transport system permease protein